MAVPPPPPPPGPKPQALSVAKGTTDSSGKRSPTGPEAGEQVFVLLVYGFGKSLSDADVHNQVVGAIRVVDTRHLKQIRRIDIRPDKKHAKKKFAVLRLAGKPVARDCQKKMDGMCLPSGVILRVPAYTLNKTAASGADSEGSVIPQSDSEYERQFPDLPGSSGAPETEGHVIISGSGKIMTSCNYVGPSKLVRANLDAPAGKQGTNTLG